MLVSESQNQVGSETGRTLSEAWATRFFGKFLVLGVLSAIFWFCVLDQAAIFILVSHFSQEGTTLGIVTCPGVDP